MDAGFELFDHTADLGIRVTGPTRESLIHPAAQGVYAAIGELASTGPAETVLFDFSETDASLLLRTFLSEILRMFEVAQRVVREIEVLEFSETRLRLRAMAYRLDVDRSVLLREVKAITYHELAIQVTPGVFEATVIVDI